MCVAKRGKRLELIPRNARNQMSNTARMRIYSTWYSWWWKTVNIGHSMLGTKEPLLMAIAETCPHESKVIAFDPARRQQYQMSRARSMKSVRTLERCSRWWKTVNMGHSKLGTKDMPRMAIAETCPHESKVIAFDSKLWQPHQRPSQCHPARFTVLCCTPGGGKQSI